MAAKPEGRAHLPRELERYLIPEEQIIFLIRRHWLVIAEPILTAVAGFVLFIAVVDMAPGNRLRIDDLVLLVWFALLLRLAYRLIDWWHEHFLATDRRLMLVHGFLTRKVDIMPMAKVTDMRYDRTVPGRIFGYGIYIVESAGQDQALSRINFVPNSDLHYQQISAVIFAPTEHRTADRVRPGRSGSGLPITEPSPGWWRRR